MKWIARKQSGCESFQSRLRGGSGPKCPVVESHPSGMDFGTSTQEWQTKTKQCHSSQQTAVGILPSQITSKVFCRQSLHSQQRNELTVRVH